MRNYTMPEWAEHYTRRAAGAQRDADAARQAGDIIDADKLDAVAEAYRADAARWLEILQGDEPGAQFKVSKRRPLKAPKAGATHA